MSVVVARPLATEVPARPALRRWSLVVAPTTTADRVHPALVPARSVRAGHLAEPVRAGHLTEPVRAGHLAEPVGDGSGRASAFSMSKPPHRGGDPGRGERVLASAGQSLSSQPGRTSPVS